MANEIVVNRSKVTQIRSRLSALHDEIQRAADSLAPANLPTSRGAGARALSDLSDAVTWLAGSLGDCAGRCDLMLAEALSNYEAADNDVARRIK